MERTPSGTSVGVEDPYAHVDRCDHCTDEGKCRFAVEQGERDRSFARDRRREDYRCPVVGEPAEQGLTGPWDWADCPHFRCQQRERECERCGLADVRLAHDSERPLLEEHHLSYPESGSPGPTGGGVEPGHEITVYLCRWCHAKVHTSWAAITDEVGPDPEAIAAREARRDRERAELSFESAAERLSDE